MIQKLRRQFIVIAMCSTLAVLTVIIGALNVINYVSMVNKKDEIMTILSENNGMFPSPFYGREMRPWGGEEPLPDVQPAGNEREGKKANDNPMEKEFHGIMKRNEFTREMPYETRFFSVTLDEQGEVVATNGNSIASIDEDTAKSYAQTVYLKMKKRQGVKGFWDEYRYRITETDEGYYVLFVDCATDLSGFRKVLATSVGVSALGFVAVLLLVLFFSKKVFRPVEESDRKQKQFITDASHELKTPLTIISANVEVMEMESEESQWSTSIKKQIDRMISLIEQMVTLSRLDEQKEGMKERFSLSDAVMDTAQSYLPVAESQGKEFEIDVAEELFMVGDEKQIRQMTGLLLDNAMKYAAVKTSAESSQGDNPQKPRIKLSLTTKGKKAVFRLWNTSDQDLKGNQDTLFERFYRPDSSRNSRTGGSGIGLSIVKSIVEAHHGKITATGMEDGSIEFKATLPLNT